MESGQDNHGRNSYNHPVRDVNDSLALSVVMLPNRVAVI